MKIKNESILKSLIYIYLNIHIIKLIFDKKMDIKIKIKKSVKQKLLQNDLCQNTQVRGRSLWSLTLRQICLLFLGNRKCSVLAEAYPRVRACIRSKFLTVANFHPTVFFYKVLFLFLLYFLKILVSCVDRWKSLSRRNCILTRIWVQLSIGEIANLLHNIKRSARRWNLCNEALSTVE